MKKKISVILILVVFFTMFLGNYSKAESQLIKVSLADNQSSEVKSGEKVYLKVETKESVSDVELSFAFIGENVQGYRTFSANIQDINTKPYIVIPEIENELYGKCVLDTIVMKDAAGNRKIYTNHQGGADGFINDEDVIKLTVAKQTKTDNTTEKTDNTTAKIENTTTKTDNTTANKKIPKAGKSTVLLIILALIIINCAGLYIHKKIR